MAIGQLEFRRQQLTRSYSAFYSCVRTRRQLLGHNHTLTLAAEEMLSRCQSESSERLYCAMELKDKAQALRWLQSGPSTLTYAAGLYIQRLSDEAVLTSLQLKDLLSAAQTFHRTRLSNNSSSSGSMDESVDGLLSLLNQSQSLRTTSTVSESPQKVVSVQHHSPSPIRNSPLPGAQGKIKSISINTARNLYGNSSTTSIKAPKSPVPASPTPPTITIPSPIPTKTVTKNVPSPAPVASPVTSTPKSWRRIPTGSPLRPQSPSAVPSPAQYAAPSLQLHSAYKLLRDPQSDQLLLLQRPGPRALRDCLRGKMAAFGLIAWLGEKQSQRAAVESTTVSTSASGGTAPTTVLTSLPLPPSTRRPSSSSTGSAASKSSKTATTVASTSSTPGNTNSTKLGGKDALSAMLSKRFAPPPPPPPPNPNTANPSGSNQDKPASTPSGGASTNKAIPIPPPVPTTWPPIPYTLAPVDGQPKSVATLLLASLDQPAEAKASRPKLKQAQLTQLNNVEGTFWAEPQEVLIPVSVVYCLWECTFLIYPIHISRPRSSSMTWKSSLQSG
jgi:hypothetical protein